MSPRTCRVSLELTDARGRMDSMMFKRSDYLLLLAVVTSSTVVASPAFAQQKLGAPPGRGSYIRYCSACHGEDAKGNGPKATPPEKPADLTQLAKNNNGTFPAA